MWAIACRPAPAIPTWAARCEEICSAPTLAVVNTNDVPVASIFLSQVGCTDRTLNVNLTTVEEDACIVTSVTTNGASLTDGDGYATRTAASEIHIDSFQQSIQTSTAAMRPDLD